MSKTKPIVKSIDPRSQNQNRLNGHDERLGTNEDVKLTGLQELEMTVNNFLVQNQYRLTYSEIVGYFELKLVELKESWRLQSSANLQNAMAANAANAQKMQEMKNQGLDHDIPQG
jgi:hypothetical protein